MGTYKETEEKDEVISLPLTAGAVCLLHINLGPILRPKQPGKNCKSQKKSQPYLSYHHRVERKA
jgi:hypothetical protein